MAYRGGQERDRRPALARLTKCAGHWKCCIGTDRTNSRRYAPTSGWSRNWDSQEWSSVRWLRLHDRHRSLRRVDRTRQIYLAQDLDHVPPSIRRGRGPDRGLRRTAWSGRRTHPDRRSGRDRRRRFGRPATVDRRSGDRAWPGYPARWWSAPGQRASTTRTWGQRASQQRHLGTPTTRSILWWSPSWPRSCMSGSDCAVSGARLRTTRWR